MTAPEPTRRSFLTTASAAMLVGGGVMAAGVLGAAVGAPSADVRARRLRIPLDTPRLVQGGAVLRSFPTGIALVFRRTPQEVEQAIYNASRMTCLPVTVWGEPVFANSATRSLTPMLAVFDGRCPYDWCVVGLGRREGLPPLFCPCCGSRFDAAGRKLYGPARRDLYVPDYRFDGQVLEIRSVAALEPERPRVIMPGLACPGPAA